MKVKFYPFLAGICGFLLVSISFFAEVCAGDTFDLSYSLTEGGLRLQLTPDCRIG